MRTIDTVLDEADPPAQLGIDDRTLNQNPLAICILEPLEAAFAVSIAQKPQILAFWARRQVAGHQGRIGVSGAVAILAADLHRVGNLAVDQAIAVAVLREMAIGGRDSRRTACPSLRC